MLIWGITQGLSTWEENRQTQKKHLFMPCLEWLSFYAQMARGVNWLIGLENISIKPVQNNIPVSVSPRLTVTPLVVPHRDEFSETVGFLIEGSVQTRTVHS